MMVCLAIVAIIAGIAIPNIMSQNPVGKPAMWRGQRVQVLARDMKTNPTTYLIRTPTGEAHVLNDELSPVVDVEKQ
jgi:competence protein ComGC